jgi:hypothetical protein
MASPPKIDKSLDEPRRPRIRRISFREGGGRSRQRPTPEPISSKTRDAQFDVWSALVPANGAGARYWCSTGAVCVCSLDAETFMNGRRLTFGVLLPGFIERAERGELPSWLSQRYCGDPSEIDRIVTKSKLPRASKADLLGLAATLDHCLATEPFARGESPAKQRDLILATTKKLRNLLMQPEGQRIREAAIEVELAEQAPNGDLCFDVTTSGSYGDLLQAAENVVAQNATRQISRSGRRESFHHAALLALFGKTQNHLGRPMSRSELNTLASDLLDEVFSRHGSGMAPRHRDLIEVIVPTSRQMRPRSD